MAYQESEMEWEEFWEWIHNLEDGYSTLLYNFSLSGQSDMLIDCKNDSPHPIH